MAISRKSSRAKLAEILTTTCTQASTVLAYQPSITGATPAVYVRSMSADRPPLTVRGKFTRFVFDILIVVAQADLHDRDGWSEENAEDLLDDLEASVCVALTTYRVVAGYWNGINYAAPSLLEHFVEDGVPYIVEIIKVAVEVQRDA